MQAKTARSALASDIFTMTTKATWQAELRRRHAYAELVEGPRYEIEVEQAGVDARLHCADNAQAEQLLAALLQTALREEALPESQRLPIARLVDVYEIWEGERPERLMSEQDYHAFLCVDCRQSTLFGHEYYMVTDEVWAAARMGENDGMLCVGCLERRIGHELRAEDFAAAAINQDPEMLRSERLQERIERI